METNLLVASHIIPWSDNVTTRLDPSNGLCLFSLYDSLFDRGYFTVSCDLRIVSDYTGPSLELGKILDKIRNSHITSPVKSPIKKEYLEYHQDVIFQSYTKQNKSD